LKLKIYIIIFISTVLFNRCNKNNDTSEFTDTPIIEAYFIPGNYAIVKISRQTPFSSSVKYSSDNINNLIISLTCNNVSYILLPLGDGRYIDSTLVVNEGDEYYLSFIYNSKKVNAYTKVPTKPVNYTQTETEIYMEKTDSTSMPSMSSMPDPIKLTWTNSDVSYYLVVIENMESTLVAIRDFGSKTPPGNMFREAPVVSSGIEIRPMEFQYFGKHRLILFHVLPDYATLYNQTNTNSQNLTNPSTSIVNGYGIFTGYNSDTLYLNVIEK
jgi:hypothetical protein